MIGSGLPLRALPLLLALLGVAAPAGAQAPTPTATPGPTTDIEGVLTKMNAAYKGVSAISGRFVQTSTGVSYMEPMVQTGTIALEAPGKMRWDFQGATDTQYRSDGTTLWVVEPAERRCTVFSSVDAMLQLLYGFLTGSADPREHFAVTLADEPTSPVPGALGLKLAPKAKDGMFESVRVYLDKDSHRVSGVSVLTPFGDRTDVVLSDVTLPPDLPDADFVFTPGEGWRTIQGD